MKSTPQLRQFSQKLRTNMTKEERHLWYDFLKKLPVTVSRQKILGNYIVDFFIASEKLAVELDGSQHYSEEGIANDIKRDDWLHEHGITVLRYTNRQISEEFDAVCEDILHHIKGLPSITP